ncbi:MAG: hypothetical protein K2Q22_11245, partial [Cytophagales bacterium]|nr:hypothetical protein [Cytophagales bacterium]
MRLILSIIFSIQALSLFAQGKIPIGTWRLHTPYRYSNCVEYVSNRVYVGTNNGLFYYDIIGDNVETFTKIDGLNESIITAIKFDTLTKQLLVAYNSGAIDILTKDDVYYFTDIKRSTLIGNKSITHINIYKGNAYVSTGIGLMVMDLKKKEIKESYSNLSNSVDLTAVKNSTVYKDTLFVITNNGILSAPLSNAVNRMDFKNWKSYGLADSISTSLSQVSSNSTWVFAAGEKDYLYRYGGGKWKRLFSTKSSPDKLRKLHSMNGKTLLSFGSLTLLMNDSLKKIDTLWSW